MVWSNPIFCDLIRTSSRVSVPKANEHLIPMSSGIYIIINPNEKVVQNQIIYIGKAGFRSGKGLRSRIANSCGHSGCEKIAVAINNGTLKNNLKILWLITPIEQVPDAFEGLLLKLFEKEFHRKPQFNSRNSKVIALETYNYIYSDLKERIQN